MRTSSSFLQWIENHHVWLVGLVFVVHLLVGLSIFADYGVHWDEMNNQRFGERWFDYCVQVVSERSLDPQFELVKHDYIHGPSFELLLAAIERVVGLQDSRSVILMRHAVVFLVFHVAAVCFFFLCRRLFNSWSLGLLGFVLLVVHPRIFAHAFFNSVDLPFLSFYIVAMLTLVKLIEDNSPRAAAVHALTCALLITVRAAGGFVAICTVAFLLADFAILRTTEWKQVLRNGAIFTGLLILFVFLMWPLLWSDPWGALIQSGEAMSFGTRAVSPWYYNVVWIGVTTPFLIIALFLIGFGVWLFSVSGQVVDDAKDCYRRNKCLLVLLLHLVVPVVLPILVKSRLFSGWRHHYFVYPVIVVFCVLGAQALYRTVGWGSDRTRSALASLVMVIGLSPAVFFIARSHPHQQVYANAMAGENHTYARAHGALDYWGVSYRQQIEHLIETRTGRLRLSSHNIPGYWNLQILTPEQRERVRFIRKVNKNTQYFMTNFRHMPPPFPLDREIHAIEVQGEKISAMFERPE